MKLLFDLHTHTVYSHGAGTVMDNAAAARRKGMGCAISDHGAGHRFYGVRPEKMANMRREIDEANDRLGGRVVIQGVEANLVGRGRTDLDECGGAPDIALLGLHKGAGMAYALPLIARSGLDREGAAGALTDSLICALSDERIALVTHPGLYAPVDMPRLAAACARMGVLLELSARHPMEPALAESALRAGARFAFSSDAHSPENVCDFGEAQRLAARCGIPDAFIANSTSFDWPANLRLAKVRDWILSISKYE